jgi:hypothetical protein
VGSDARPRAPTYGVRDFESNPSPLNALSIERFFKFGTKIHDNPSLLPRPLKTWTNIKYRQTTVLVKLPFSIAFFHTPDRRSPCNSRATWTRGISKEVMVIRRRAWEASAYSIADGRRKTAPSSAVLEAANGLIIILLSVRTRVQVMNRGMPHPLHSQFVLRVVSEDDAVMT